MNRATRLQSKRRGVAVKMAHTVLGPPNYILHMGTPFLSPNSVVVYVCMLTSGTYSTGVNRK